MSADAVHCPRCGHSIHPRPAAGAVMRCANCPQVFTVDAAGYAVPTIAEPQAATPLPHVVSYASAAGFGPPTVANRPATLSLVCAFLFYAVVALLFVVSRPGGALGGAAEWALLLTASLTPIVALVLGIVGLQRTRDRRVVGRRRAIAGIALGGIALFLLIMTLMTSSLNRAT